MKDGEMGFCDGPKLGSNCAGGSREVRPYSEEEGQTVLLCKKCWPKRRRLYRERGRIQ